MGSYSGPFRELKGSNLRTHTAGKISHVANRINSLKRAGGGKLLLIEEEAHRAKPTGRPSAEQKPNLDSLKTGVLMVCEMSSSPCLRLVSLNKDRGTDEPTT